MCALHERLLERWVSIAVIVNGGTTITVMVDDRQADALEWLSNCYGCRPEDIVQSAVERAADRVADIREDGPVDDLDRSALVEMITTGILGPLPQVPAAAQPVYIGEV